MDIKLTETKNLTGTAVGAKAVLGEMLSYALNAGLTEGKSVEFTSSYFVWLDDDTLYSYTDEGIKAIVELAEKEGIKISANNDGSGITGIEWKVELND